MQPGFFDFDDLNDKLNQHNDPLAKINELVDWAAFRPVLSKIRMPRSSNKGRPRSDTLLMFKMIFLRHYYSLSLKQVEYQVLDRLSFRRFLGLSLEDPVPDANTVWKYEELLVQKNLSDELFYSLLSQIEAHGYRPQGGQIVDATLVEAPKRKTEEQQQEKARKAQEKSDGNDDDSTPPAPQERTPAQQRQANRDAAWTKKHGKSYFGYKNHTSVDKKHKLIRSYEATAAKAHDGHQLEALIDGDNSSADVWADSAYRSAENESMLKDRGYRSHIHRKKPRGKDMPERSKLANQKRSQVRARVEHVYADMKRDGKKFMVRCIGQARAELRIGLMNMVYNTRRWSFLSRVG
jgi:IS5 family transposase